jgi:hypothetical protein
MKRLASRLPLGVLAILAVTGMLLQAGSLPHVHEGDEAGFFNEEHDLTLLAGLAAHVIPVDAAPTIALATISALLVLFIPERPGRRLANEGVSRAPPVR